MFKPISCVQTNVQVGYRRVSFLDFAVALSQHCLLYVYTCFGFTRKGMVGVYPKSRQSPG